MAEYVVVILFVSSILLNIRCTPLINDVIIIVRPSSISRTATSPCDGTTVDDLVRAMPSPHRVDIFRSNSWG